MTLTDIDYKLKVIKRGLSKDNPFLLFYVKWIGLHSNSK